MGNRDVDEEVVKDDPDDKEADLPDVQKDDNKEKVAPYGS